MDITFVIAAISLTIAAFWLKNTILAISATFAWLVLSGAAYFKQTGYSDPYFYLFIFGISMTIILPIATFELYNKSKEAQDDYSEDRDWKHKERNEPKYSTLSGGDRLRIKHHMGVSHIKQRRDNDRDSGWE